MKGIIISSDKSNSGKTTISLALMKILSKYGKVRGYKVGPDFIDPKFHELATGYPSINLDYFISGKMVKDYFLKYGRGFDYGIVEGVMGLYDGLGGDYSTYHISRYLGLPIIIVMDCGFNSTTASAIIYGLKYFGNADIRGVIFNNVASRSHHHDCAIKLPPGVMDLGYIKHDNEINIKSRHLGLYLPDSSTISKIKRVSDIVEEQIDINSLISIMENFEIAEDKDQINTDSTDKPKAAIALDDAFSFYYSTNLDLIRRNYNIEFFSPLRNEVVEDAELIYIGGGYPELYPKYLQDSKRTISWLINNSEKGIPIFAECGGLMYLSKTLEIGGNSFNMVGIFNAEVSMNSSLTIGYTELMSEFENILVEKDVKIKGHEFHKSKVLNYSENTVFRNIRGKGLGDGRDGMLYKNTLATYSHFMFLGNEGFLIQ